MVNPDQAARRALPSVDRLLSSAPVTALIAQYGRMLTVDVIRDLLQAQREKLAQGTILSNSTKTASSPPAAMKWRSATRRRCGRCLISPAPCSIPTSVALMPQSVADAVMVAMTRRSISNSISAAARAANATRTSKNGSRGSLAAMAQ